MNSLYVISPYRKLGMWVFDDPRAGLVEEPFVGGADTIIDVWVKEFPHPDKGFRLIFGAEPFPGFQWTLQWLRPELSGNVYLCQELGMEGWLCPALFKYFDTAPAALYTRCEPLPQS